MVIYKFVKDNKLSVVMEVKVKDKVILVNLVYYIYWNFGGYNFGDILFEEIQILGLSYIFVDGEFIFIGKILLVK